MERLLASLEKTKRGPVSGVVKKRMAEFSRMGKRPEDMLFKELCFCLLTANFSAERAIAIQEAAGDAFLNMPRSSLARTLRQLGHRFPNTRARYIAKARRHRGKLRIVLSSSLNDTERRNWLVENVLGLGYKEASHFLRNTGYSDVAIIDFHIIDLLVAYGVIKKPKTKSLSPKRYLEIERTLASIAKAAGLSQGELDLYLWYMETRTVLK